MILTLPLLARWRVGCFALGFALLLSGCSDKTKTAGRGAGGAAPVVAGKVRKKIIPLTLDAIGAVEPSRTAALRSQVTGNLLKIHFQEGQEVKQGDLLFELDSRPFQHALRSAEADLQKTQVQLDTARTQVTRYRKLTAEAMISEEQFQSIVDSERVLSAQLLSSEAALATAQLELEYCSIRAPITGRTGNLGAHEGDLVRASDTTISLVIINQISPIDVTFSVPQQYLGALNRYQAEGSVGVRATPPGTDEDAEKGGLTFVDNAIDSTTGTLKLKASFPNVAHRLWPGQFAIVRVTLATPEVLVIPSAALQNDQKGQHVFVIKDDNTAEFRTVAVERTSGADAVITQGLSEGETVVTDGQLRVIPGKPVEIKSSGTDTAPAPEKHKGKSKAT